MVKIFKANILNWFKTRLNSVANNIKMNGTQNAGSSELVARADHVHPTDTSRAASTHTHGNVSNDGKVGTAANKPLITGTNGVVQAGSFGTAANTFCQGNDSRLSDARTPKSHAVNANTYGLGTTGVYGHVKTVNGLTQVSHNDGLALSAYQGKVLNDALAGKADSNHTHTKSEISDFPTSMTPTSHTHMLKDISITSAIGANSDLNEITDVGIYTCGATNSGTLANRPPYFGNYSLLIENKIYNNTTIVQYVTALVTESPLTWCRFKGTGDWSQWTHMGGCSATVPANTDLNDLTDLTIYSCNTNNSATLGNKPFTGNRACIIQNKVYNNHKYFIQFVYMVMADNSLNEIYYRVHSKGTWLNWKKVINDNDLATKADVEHNHLLGDIQVTGVLGTNEDLNNYTEVGIYTCSKTNSGTLTNKPYSSNYSCIIENKLYGSGSIVQFVYKVTTNATTCYDSYFRCYTANTWTDWIRVYTDKDFVVSDSLTDTSAKNALSAKQGKVLNDALANKADSNHTHTKSQISDFPTISSSVSSTSTTQIANSNAVKTAYDKANSIVSGNSSSATVASLPTGWSGTVTYYRRNGFMIVTYEWLQKTSTSSSLETLFSLEVNNDLGYGVFDNGSTAISDDGVLVQVSANGAFRARCLKANTPKYGHIIFPYS